MPILFLWLSYMKQESQTAASVVCQAQGYEERSPLGRLAGNVERDIRGRAAGFTLLGLKSNPHGRLTLPDAGYGDT